MHAKRARVVVTGYVGLLPAGGVSWDYLQYVLGFQALGCDVLYLEDTQQWPSYNASGGSIDCHENIQYLHAVMRLLGLSDRWAYRDEVSGVWFGKTQADVEAFLRSADVFVNISCSSPMRELTERIPIRVLIDTDPMFTQVQCLTGVNMYQQPSALPQMLAAHTHLFSFGENIGQPDCAVPTLGREWIATRQPVALGLWDTAAARPADGAYTTVMNWTAARAFAYDGRQWGQKNTEFLRVLELPSRIPHVPFAVAVGQTTGDRFPAADVTSAGWRVDDPRRIAADVDSYRNYIWASRGEFSVAKHTYVQANTGWFSCRSACYLAAGRPVVTQETGWSKTIPSGSGLFTFRTEDEAVAAITEIERDPARHGAAARKIAHEMFDSARVLGAMLDRL